MRLKILFCPTCSQFPIATGLARFIEQTGWDLSVDLDKKASSGEFAVYIDDEIIFSRFEKGRFPDPIDILPAIRNKLFGDALCDG